MHFPHLSAASVLIAAEDRIKVTWWLLLLFAAIGAFAIFQGVQAIRTRRQAMTGRGGRLMRLFGVTEITGPLAVASGYLSVGVGVLILGVTPFLPYIASQINDEARREAGQEPDHGAAPANTNRIAMSATPGPRPAGMVTAAERLAQQEREKASQPAASSADQPSAAASGQPTAQPAEPVADAAPPAMVLGEPKQSLPLVEYSDSEVQVTARAGDKNRPARYSDRAPPGGLLVGARVVFNEPNNGVIVGLQPIYQVGDKYALGRFLGTSAGWGEQIVAEPGFAVGGIEVGGAFGPDGLQFTFYRMAADGLSNAESYQSPWLGRSAHKPQSLTSGRDVIVGFVGAADDRLRSIGVYYADQLARKLGAATVTLPPWVLPRSSTPVVVVENRDSESFRDGDTSGGVLVGLRVVQGEEWGGAVRALQPIYQIGDKYKLGAWCGEPGGPQTVLLARPGYVVGRIDVRAGLIINALQLQYAAVKNDRLVVGDWYSSEWVGSDGGGPKIPPDEPALIVGISGRSRGSLEALTYYTIPARVNRATRDAAAKSADDPSRPVTRKWTSANGNYTIEATLVRADGEQATLKQADGKEVNVKLDQLSGEDRAIVSRWRAGRGSL